ncbi:M23 family metallopeptidase [Rhizomicrobium electricum]|uniref:M23 family metallopeptidase n=1 Tax=Rhizomicrobium electricum TaxID=480070 RepID=A0ABN1EWE1_9PROT|nr:M23 family metallopeptidase [Rhizomicrobium electricum]NIJ50019.1 murein DD-endopeptidase MepM/ murein hydrolase activator NlpD [Rhizomicrobium electricum]
MRWIALFAAAAVPVFAADTIAFDLPVACAVGKTCFIQQYFDHDPGPGATDYTCGVKSYDGHDGVDIRLPTQAAMRQGVDVLAAAPGVVKGVRDGMQDADVRLAGAASVKGRECGNGVVIAHDGGWETQYCHMANGSVRAKVGDRVAAGTVLGRIGESGDAAFPHLHFSVRHDGAKLDPFATEASCGKGASLWSAKAKATLAYRAPQIINTGFAGAPVSMDQIESGPIAPPDGQSAALVAYVRTIALKAGDVQELTILAPGGGVLVAQKNAPLDANKAQWMLFGGKKRPPNGFAPGRYTARYQVTRAGKPVLADSFFLDLR